MQPLWSKSLKILAEFTSGYYSNLKEITTIPQASEIKASAVYTNAQNQVSELSIYTVVEFSTL